MDGSAPEPSTPLQDGTSAPPAPLRVLYVDDDPALGRLVQRQLGRLGFEVVLAGSGEDGLALVAAERFDVVALDHYMPGQDGITTLRAIRALDRPPPVVYVTGAQDGRLAVAALKAGAADYVVKEVQADFIELLRAAFVAAVEQVRMRRAHEAAEAEIRAARDRFEALAAERALLLREMNHRVGNSLQIIVSLLNVQASATEDGRVKEALNSARNRVSAVAQVHRRLYTSDQIATVALDQYIGSLLDDLQVSAHRDLGGITITLDADPIHIDPDRAVAVGIIATELVINAMKYAYPGGEGAVRVALKRQGERIDFTVEDDGAGMAAPKAAETGAIASSGLGTRIVRAMSTKLGCEPTLDARETGTCVRLTFRLAEHA
ncbi:response regulator [Xanthobacter oligotrophicus]|uniref:response regulator n=1 Tax=Xanthobacter oligotrophicus TaxID=2607286 RepID=UPI0011F1C43F|nr:response regulator [Xanthobacter oligotrophicus]MCG5234680.1 response regulator [Xanthobacter oligotrophicus]